MVEFSLSDESIYRPLFSRVAFLWISLLISIFPIYMLATANKKKKKRTTKSQTRDMWSTDRF